MENKNQYSCAICACKNFKFLNVRDHQIDTDNDFLYGHCCSCGCLQCLEIPNDLKNFYPDNYYSHKPPKVSNIFKKFRRSFKINFVINHSKKITWLVKLWLRDYSIFWVYRRAGLSKRNSILDVGSGTGAHVLQLKESGFPDVLGIDPFIKSDITIDNEILVMKGHLSDIKRKFDVITFHHSLEHMRNQIETLKIAHSILDDNGWVLIRIPTVTSNAFDIYKENWCGLDAPRHLYLHSHESISLLAINAGFVVKDLWCDSTEGQFIFSEEYQVGIKLSDMNSYAINPRKSIFSSRKLAHFKTLTALVNENLRGDFICVILEKGN